MHRFEYIVAASVLHDEAAVERIFSRYEPLLTRLGGQRLPAATSRADHAPAARAGGPLGFFVLTGGTERSILDAIEALPAADRGLPILLIAHPEHNSLPASLETLARLRQDGRSGTIALIRSPEDEAGAAGIAEAADAIAAVRRMRSLRIGAIGEPSDWLVASSQSAGALAEAWGPSLIQVPIAELTDRIAALRAAPGGAGADGAAAAFWSGADSRSGPSSADLDKSFSIYCALRDIIAGRSLDALTLRCFDLVTSDASTGCYALSRLADEGIDAGCEGDIPSILGLAWLRALTGEPAWMANPSFIDAGGSKGSILLAHCTVPRRGLATYGVRTHFESGLGVAVAGTFPPGPVTLVRIGGKGLDRVWIAEGEVTESPRREGLCRTQIVVGADSDKLRELLEAPLGNHILVARGRREEAARRYLALARRGEAVDRRPAG